MPQTPRSVRFLPDIDNEVPIIDSSESFSDVVSKLSNYIVKVVDAAYSWEQLRTTVAGYGLRPLIESLTSDCHHPAVVAALLAARYNFCSLDTEDTGLNESRALACELVAWQFLTFLSEKELIDFLLFELPTPEDDKPSHLGHSNRNGTPSHSNSTDGESAALLGSRSSDYNGLGPPRRPTFSDENPNSDLHEVPSKTQDALAESMAGMNALEIAAVCEAKRFLCQKPVQMIVQGIWEGEIIFWETLSVNAVKRPRSYNKRVADPFTRLRVPKYQKAFQVLFFVLFLVLYYTVLVQRNPQQIGSAEVLLYLWIIAFAYDEFGEIQDAGIMFYQTDFWSLWDLAIILVGAAFFVTSQFSAGLRQLEVLTTFSGIVGLARQSPYLTDISFDVLSLVALFLVPRYGQDRSEVSVLTIIEYSPYSHSVLFSEHW